jgi:hypothetical protein
MPAGIEEIGVSIEEPFSILPLETLCRTIEGNIRDSLAAHLQREARRQQQRQQHRPLQPVAVPEFAGHQAYGSSHAVPALAFSSSGGANGEQQ